MITVHAEPIVFTLFIQGKFIIRTNLVGPRQFELSGLHCISKVIASVLAAMHSLLEHFNIFTTYNTAHTASQLWPGNVLEKNYHFSPPFMTQYLLICYTIPTHL